MSRYTTDVHTTVGSLRRGGLPAAAPGAPNACLEAGPERWFESEPTWFKTAVFYRFRLVSEEEHERDAS